MYAFLGFGGLIGAGIFLVLLIIKVVKKEPKKVFAIAFLCCLVLFVVCLILTPTDETKIDEQKETIKTPETARQSETAQTEITRITEEAVQTEVMDNNAFIETITPDIKWALGTRDRIEDITLEDKKLNLIISLERNDKTLDRFSSVFNSILGTEEGYNLWDTITVDFGSQGSVTKTKTDLVNDETGDHFNVVDSDIVKESEATVPSETQASETTAQKLSFILTNDELGDYGRYAVLNEGTEFEEQEIMYYVPAGHYDLKNLDTNASVQLSIYSGGPEYDGEWQYFVADENCDRPVVLRQGASGEIEIKEGQFIVISDGGGSEVEFVEK